MAEKQLKSIKFKGLSTTYIIPEVDPTSTVSGDAADAKVVGDHINTQNNPHNVTLEQIGAAPTSHNHMSLSGWDDTRNNTTTPNDYNRALKVVGIKTPSASGTLDGSTYSTLMGIRGWSDSSGGNSHELAFTGSGALYHRHGSTTSWGSWNNIYTSANIVYSSTQPTGTKGMIWLKPV